MHLNGSINNSEVHKLLKLTRPGSFIKHLRNLMDIDIIEKKGGAGSNYYILK
jgi:hypothetical protein